MPSPYAYGEPHCRHLFGHVPPGSFAKHKEGYAFEGTIKDVSLEVLIKGGRVAGSYRFLAEGKEANLSGTKNPATVSLSIGDNLGTTQINSELE